MDEQNKQMQKIILAIIIVIVVIFACFATSFWSIREGYKYRKGYMNSWYITNIYTESSLENVELLIPMPANNATLMNEETQNIIETVKGPMIIIDLGDIEYNSISWRYITKLVDSDFSTQENQTIWLYSNLTNATAPIYFTIMKEDYYNTFSILDTMIDYTGVISNPYPEMFNSYDECGEYTEQHKVELLHGWNQYQITTGTFSQYAD